MPRLVSKLIFGSSTKTIYPGGFQTLSTHDAGPEGALSELDVTLAKGQFSIKMKVLPWKIKIRL